MSEEVSEGGAANGVEYRVECLRAEAWDGGSGDGGGGGAVVAEGNGGSLVGVSRPNIGNLHQNPSVCLSVSGVLGGAQR